MFSRVRDEDGLLGGTVLDPTVGHDWHRTHDPTWDRDQHSRKKQDLVDTETRVRTTSVSAGHFCRWTVFRVQAWKCTVLLDTR